MLWMLIAAVCPALCCAGWFPALGITFLLAVLTSYSGSLFSRLYQAVPTAGEASIFYNVQSRRAHHPAVTSQQQQQ
jgi:hypothetical protein